MIIDIDQFHGDAQIRLVRTIALHGLAPGEPGERILQFDLQRIAKHRANQGLGTVLNISLFYKGQLHIQLGELRLAVGAQIFVTEAARNLVVTIHAGHHQQLLENLRRLRQRVELPRVHPAGHQVIARAFRRGLGQDRCLKLGIARRLQVMAYGLVHARSDAHVVLHAWAPQIQVAVAQADFLAVLIRHEQRQRR